MEHATAPGEASDAIWRAQDDDDGPGEASDAPSVSVAASQHLEERQKKDTIVSWRLSRDAMCNNSRV